MQFCAHHQENLLVGRREAREISQASRQRPWVGCSGPLGRPWQKHRMIPESPLRPLSVSAVAFWTTVHLQNHRGGRPLQLLDRPARALLLRQIAGLTSALLCPVAW